MIELTRRKNDEDMITEVGVNDIELNIVNKVKKIAKKDFAQFSAIVAVLFSVGLWVIKSLWYAYMSGKLSVYKIDRCYINADNENVFLQIIQLVAIFIVWVFINYVYYKISVAEDKSKKQWKKKIKILVFWIVEMFFAFIFVLFSTHIKMRDFVGEITLVKIISLIIVFFILCLMVNIYAVELLIEKWRKKRRKKANNQKKAKETKGEQSIKDVLLSLIITIALELIFVFLFAAHTEYSKSGYKVIMVQSEKTMENKYDIKYGEKNNKYEMYPITYENEDCYIVARLYREDGEIMLDYDFQRVLEKEGQEIIYIENINNLSTDK